MKADANLIDALDRGCLIVTANQRLARSLRNEYAVAMIERGKKAWFRPRILSWEKWIESLWFDAAGDRQPKILLSRSQSRILWEQIISGDLQDPSVGRLAKNARDAWRLMQEWQIPTNDLERFDNADSRSLARWIRTYQQRLERNHWIDEDMLVDVIDSNLNEKEILLAGFYELNRRQTQLIEKFKGAGVSVANLSREGQEGESELRVCPDTEQEFLAAACWARDQLCGRPESILAVIVPGLSRQRGLVERIFTRTLQPASILPGGDAGRNIFHISVGRPLVEQSLVCAALLGLKLVTTGLDSHELSRFLRSPFYNLGASAWQCARLDVIFRERWMESASPANIAWRCGNDAALGSMQKVMKTLHEKKPGRVKMDPAVWSERFTEWLRTIGWPGERSLNSEEFQTTVRWHELLNNLGKLGPVCGKLSAAEALNNLERIATETEFQARTPGAAVQVMGTLEAAGSRFDALWICGLDDESFPAPPQLMPLIPASLQIQYGLPHATAEHELEFSSRMLGSLRSSAAEVVLSWSKTVDDEPRRPSPLLRTLMPGDAGAKQQAVLSINPVAESLLNTPLESVDDHNGPAVAAEGKQKGGTGIFTYQSQCPFKAFALIRLAADQLESPEPGISPRLKGSVAHKTLEYLWQQLKSKSGLIDCNDGGLRKMIGDGFDKAWAALKAETMFIGDGSRLLEKARQQKLILRLMAYEKKRMDFVVMHTEELVEAEVGGLTIGMRIDRVDWLVGDQRQLIIDYKTGSDSANEALGVRPEKPQLAVYATANPKDLAGVCIARLHAESCEYDALLADPVLADRPKAFRGSKRADEDSANWDELLLAWRQRLDRLGKDFRAGDSRTDPTKHACDYCHLGAACRILEMDEQGKKR